MPIYSFLCDTCGEEKDLVRKMSERNDTEPCIVEVPTKGIAKALGRRKKACKGTLKRNQGAEVNADMGHFWQP